MCGSANSVIFKLKYSCIFILKLRRFDEREAVVEREFQILEPL